MSECHSCTVIGVQECADTILETLELELQQAQEDGDLYQLHLDQLSCITDETRRADKLEHWVSDRARNEDFTITEKVPTGAFWLKAHSSSCTFQTLL